MTATSTDVRREESTFRNRQGMKLFERRWLPPGSPRAVIILVHGYAEHTGRYDHVGAWLAERGYALRGFDLRGHGLSDGPRAFVESFREFLDDLREYLPRVRAEHAGAPLLVLGHSMGGTITSLWLAVDQPPLTGAILSGPVAATGDRTNPVLRLLAAIGKRFPRLRLTTLAAASVSRDQEVVRRYEGDPLVYRGRTRAGLLAAMVRAVERVDRDAERIPGPVLIMHGTEDQLAAPEGSQRLDDRIGAADCTLKLYRGLYHEILNEPEKDQVLGDMLSWIEIRVGVASDGAAAR
jgi:alpha-beta hydrolase superfamily lysophospholipase